MVRKAITLVALVLTAAGCSHATSAARGVEPSASVGDVMRPLAGHWQGTIYETAGSLVTGSTPVDIRIAEDGTWRGTIGKAAASGRADLRRRRLVLSGTTQTPDGARQPVYFTLTGDERRRWGETMGMFGGRSERAEISMNRAA